jgi:hypothetical protein
MMDDPPKSFKNRSLELKWAREQIKSLSKKEVRSFREKWLDTSDVLMALRISRRTLQKLRTQGLLPFVRLAGKLFYKGKDLDTLLTSRYRKSKKTKNNE